MSEHTHRQPSAAGRRARQGGDRHRVCVYRTPQSTGRAMVLTVCALALAALAAYAFAAGNEPAAAAVAVAATVWAVAADRLRRRGGRVGAR